MRQEAAAATQQVWRPCATFHDMLRKAILDPGLIVIGIALRYSDDSFLDGARASVSPEKAGKFG